MIIGTFETQRVDDDGAAIRGNPEVGAVLRERVFAGLRFASHQDTRIDRYTLMRSLGTWGRLASIFRTDLDGVEFSLIGLAGTSLIAPIISLGWLWSAEPAVPHG